MAGHETMEYHFFLKARLHHSIAVDGTTPMIAICQSGAVFDDQRSRAVSGTLNNRLLVTDEGKA